MSAVVDLGLTLALLGRHVVRRAHDRAGARLVRDLLLGLRELREAEVEHLDEVLGAASLQEKDVLGLEIAVDDAVLVGRVEGVRDLRADHHGTRRIEVPLAFEAIGQRLALQVLHDEIELATRRRAEVGDVDDVLVADLVDRLRFLHEARDDLGVARQLGVDRLERDLLANNRVLGEVHHAHAPLAQPGCEPVVPYRLTDVDHSAELRALPFTPELYSAAR